MFVEHLQSLRGFRNRPRQVCFCCVARTSCISTCQIHVCVIRTNPQLGLFERRDTPLICLPVAVTVFSFSVAVREPQQKISTSPCTCACLHDCHRQQGCFVAAVVGFLQPVAAFCASCAEQHGTFLQRCLEHGKHCPTSRTCASNKHATTILCFADPLSLRNSVFARLAWSDI